MQRRRFLALALSLPLVACGGGADFDGDEATRGHGPPPLYPNETPRLRRMIRRAARRHGVPVSLVQRVILRESDHRPGARNGPYYGLMQIHPRTAATMGYRGPPEGLLDPATNLEYAVKYLRGAWLVSGGDPDAAVGWYARGYYYEAKRMDLLEETGLA